MLKAELISEFLEWTATKRNTSYLRSRSWTPIAPSGRSARMMLGLFGVMISWVQYIPGRNFRSNCRNYRRALLLFEMDVANPPSPVQIEAIVFSRSKAKNCFYLNEPLENMQKHRVFWVLLIKYDKFSGKLTRIVHFCAKMCKKTCVFNSFSTFDSMFDCAVCSIARQVEHDQCFPFWAKTNETQTRQCFAVWMFLKVSTSKQSNQIEAFVPNVQRQYVLARRALKRPCICKRLRTNWKFTCKLLYTFGFLVNPRLATSRANVQQTIQYAYVYIYSLAILDSSTQIYVVLSSVASPNPKGIDPRPGSWGEKKVLGSAGKHVFGEFRGILQEKCLSSTNSRSNRSNC